MAQRYIKFDVDALHRVIFDVCGSPVVGMEKKEGLFNKSFMVTLADGQEVTARIKVSLSFHIIYTYVNIDHRTPSRARHTS